ncbi:MAG: leucine-rich repeat domain-containing protein [Bacteroidaceae bacterium]|nr:leucine-rich repeat domain-containing protein [Bacteroidaceae bacterium]
MEKFDFYKDGIYYKLNPDKKTVSVTRQYIDCQRLDSYHISKLSIPSNVTWEDKTYTVTIIECDAFNSCRNLKEIIIPNSITYIGDGAFKNCIMLASINIPNSISRIGNHTFIV